MPNDLLKHQIEAALKNFSTGTLAENATALFHALGYRSNKGLTLAPNTAETFRAEFDRDGIFNAEAASALEWQSVDLVFQLTDDEINAGAQKRLFETRAVDARQANSYLVFCIQLSEPHYSRTQLANITRAVNKLFPMPALILFQHGETLTLAVIDRRAHKRDADKDVLEKVTLIKDIRVVEPHRAHVEILFDLALPTLAAAHAPTNWSELHAAWRRVLDTSELNKKFFKELANWYFWAQQRVVFPKPASNTDSAETWRAMNVIRLITRLMFVWFIKEKGLVPDDLFEERRVKILLKSLAGKESTYYKAILQNLFFGTLNTEMRDKDGKPNRKFIKRSSQFHNSQHLVHNVYRYHDAFADADAFLELCADIPFLNGGLFECLDLTNTERIDGFSEHEKNPLRVPNELFFADWHTEDLSAAYGSPKTDKVRGLLEILSHYKFTVDENTPIEEEIALDPELLGKVFENLLAAYNPETGVTARKQTGSFYTPREIVNYMVDEALVAYLESALSLRGTKQSLTTNTEIASSQSALLAVTNDTRATDASLRGTKQSPAMDSEIALDDKDRRLAVTNDTRATDASLRGTEQSPAMDSEIALDDKDRRLAVTNDTRATDASLRGTKQSLTTNTEIASSQSALLAMTNEARLRRLLSYTTDQPFDDQETRALVNAIDNLKVLDPACGSGAFPLGVLHKLVHILRKLDPGNLIWKEKQIANAYGFGMDSALDVSLAEIERTFERNEDDYARKLYLIQNCIYGVDIQPIAAQIAKLRCFISLIVDETLDDTKENRGIIPLPNLETKFVAANTLIGIDRPHVIARSALRDEAISSPAREIASSLAMTSVAMTNAAMTPDLEQKCNDLADILRQYLKVKNPVTQKKYLELGEALGAEINAALAGRAGFEPLNINWLFTTATSVDALLERLPIQKQAQAKTLTLRRDDIKEKEKQLEQVRRAMFGARTFSKKKQFREQDARLRAEIADLLKKDGMGDATAAQLAAWDPYDQNKSAPFFDADWMFDSKVADGFNIVIGNPPYGFRDVLTAEEKKFFRKEMKIEFPSGDMAELFTIISLAKCVRPDATLTFIIPKKSLYGESWGNLRQLWLKNDLRFLMDASQAFENVLLEQVAFAIQKQKTSSRSVAIGALENDPRQVRVFGEFPISEIFTADMRNAQIYRGLYPSSLLHKIASASAIDTASLLKAEIGISNITEYLTFDADGNYPCVKGIDIIRYGLKGDIRYLKGRVAKQFKGSYQEDKIIGQEIIAHIQNPEPHILITLFFDDAKRLLNDTCVEIKLLDNRLQKKFVLAYLQSTFCNWYAYNFVYNRAVRTMHFINYYVSQIPIPSTVVEQPELQKPIIKLADKIIAAKRADVKADTTAWEREIDELVYELYGLTAEEIRTVERERRER